MNTYRSPLQENAKGFTLLELVVAMAVFALVAAMAYSGLNNVLRAKEITEAKAEKLVELQKAFTFMQRDIEQIVERNFRDEYGESDPKRILTGTTFGDYLLEFTRMGWSNPSGHKRSHLQRIAYGLQTVEDKFDSSKEVKQLVRAHWLVVDRAQDSQPFKNVVLSGIKEVEIRFLDEKGKWHTVWPADLFGAGSAAGAKPKVLPIGIEMNIKTEQFGKITRLFRVPG